MTAPHDHDRVRDGDRAEGTRMTSVIELAPEVPATTEIERRVLPWIAPYNQATHLVRARDWLVYLDPDASLEARLAVVTHDIERMFPNGPTIDKATCRWDDPHYLYAHASRSAEVVGVWLHSQDGAKEEVSLSELQRLDERERVGGLHVVGAVYAAELVEGDEPLELGQRDFLLRAVL